MKFVITLEEDEDGFIVAECPSLPGCVSQGRTREEALANIEEAVKGYIASLRKHGQPVPRAEVTELEVTVA
jgi:antitoxin HicB